MALTRQLRTLQCAVLGELLRLHRVVAVLPRRPNMPTSAVAADVSEQCAAIRRRWEASRTVTDAVLESAPTPPEWWDAPEWREALQVLPSFSVEEAELILSLLLRFDAQYMEREQPATESAVLLLLLAVQSPAASPEDRIKRRRTAVAVLGTWLRHLVRRATARRPLPERPVRMVLEALVNVSAALATDCRPMEGDVSATAGIATERLAGTPRLDRVVLSRAVQLVSWRYRRRAADYRSLRGVARPGAGRVVGRPGRRERLADSDQRRAALVERASAIRGARCAGGELGGLRRQERRGEGCRCVGRRISHVLKPQLDFRTAQTFALRQCIVERVVGFTVRPPRAPPRIDADPCAQRRGGHRHGAFAVVGAVRPAAGAGADGGRHGCGRAAAGGPSRAALARGVDAICGGIVQRSDVSVATPGDGTDTRCGCRTLAAPLGGDARAGPPVPNTPRAAAQRRAAARGGIGLSAGALQTAPGHRCALAHAGAAHCGSATGTGHRHLGRSAAAHHDRLLSGRARVRGAAAGGAVAAGHADQMARSVCRRAGGRAGAADAAGRIRRGDA
eukprot:ctg_9.g5